MEHFELFGTLIMLVILQVVLGFDNLLYIALESKKAPEKKQEFVRKVGISIAIILRLILLFCLVNLIENFKNPFFKIDSNILSLEINLHSVIVLIGGGFILYTSIKEIWHMIIFEEKDEVVEKKSAKKVILMIILMNLIFSFDSILSAMALTSNYSIMAISIVIGGLLMILAANKVSSFLQKNRKYEVLGLFILFLVGVMLLSEGGEKAHLVILENPVHSMNKTTFYFIIAILVFVDMVQSKYQKNLTKNK
ncbi:tellurium resistance protein TerC [Flavobacteriales bacterium]|jgi:predicted tellurium resistance membrane protein TerC|nr:tellurium resistance protein TerC [Flavobacteriales bacterium]